MYFELDLYGICVSNNMVNREQCTLFWYVAYNKFSHMEYKVNEAIVVVVSKHFGDLIIQKVNKYTFLGIEIELTKYTTR